MIRKAEEKDLEQLLDIYSRVALDRSRLGDLAYETQIQKEGFLLGIDSEEDYRKQLSEAYSFLVFEDNGKILGYLIADHREKFYDDEYKTWFDHNLKEIYYRSPQAMSLSTLATKPNSFQKGVATALLNHLQNQLRKEGYQYLYSIITLAPLTNCPTIVWHTKNGFTRLAMGKARGKLFDLPWYSGVLLYKRL